MAENQSLDPTYETAAFTTSLPSSMEYGKYAVESDHALHMLIQHQHRSAPLKTIQSALMSGAYFYQGDWCGILDYDPDTGVWTPLWWYDTENGWMGENLFHEYELSVNAPSWVVAYKNSACVLVEDTEALKETAPIEYDLYQRLKVRNVIGVPFYSVTTGFIVVRNPKRYPVYFTHLEFLTYAIMTQIALYREEELTHLRGEQENPADSKVVRINVFGGLSIHARGFVLPEEKIKSRNFCRVLMFLLCHRNTCYSNKQLDEALLDELQRTGSTASSMNAIYRFRRDFGALTLPYRLIETYHGGYRLNYELEIHTDMDDFDALCASARRAASAEEKIDLLKKALSLYKGRVFPSGEGEHWLIPIVSLYEQRYMKALKRLLFLLQKVNDLPCIREHASHAISLEPANVEAHYWLIYALCKQNARKLASEALTNAHAHLIEEDYIDLLERLKPFRLRPHI